MKNRSISACLRRVLLVVASLVGALSGVAHAAEKFPSKRVSFIVPFAAGGTLDVFTRSLVRDLEKMWGVPVIVENRPGASEVRGVQALLASPADGHTVLVAGALSFTLNRLTFDPVPYDPDKLLPVTRMFNINLGLIVPSNSPWEKFSDFLAASKQGKGLMFGSAGGKGGQVHMAFLDVAGQSGAVMDFVPYNGLAPALNDLLGGRVDVMLASVGPPVGQHIESDRLKALAIGGGKSKAFPGIPTFAELGYPSINASFYTGLAVPAGTPSDVVEKIAVDVRKVLMDPKFVKESLDPHGIEVVADSPADFRLYLRKDLDVKREHVRKAGLHKTTAAN